MLRRLLPKIILLSLIIIGSNLGGCTKDKVATGGPLLEIGAILPLTGPVASFGRSTQNSVLLSMDYVKRRNPGLSISVKFEDSAGDPKIALSAFERLRRLERISVFITTVSSVVLSLKPAAEKENVILFADASHPDVTKDSKNVFRFANTVNSEIDAIKQFLGESEFRKAFILAINDDYGKSYTSILKTTLSVDNRFAGSDFLDKLSSDFRTVLMKAERTRPDIYILAGYGRAIGIVAKQLREIGFQGPFIASLGFLVTPDAMESAGEAVRGGFFLNYQAVQTEEARQLREQYLDRFKEEPSPSILLDYGIICIIVDTWLEANANIDKAREIMKSRREYITPFGTFQGASEGDISAPVTVYEFPSRGPINVWQAKTSQGFDWRR